MKSDRFFNSVEGMTGAIRDMENDELHRREDRAKVSSFFNGQAPYTQGEIEQLGLTVNVNYLFGYNELAGAKGQLLALYNKPSRLFEIEIEDAPAWAKQGWSMAATQEMNAIIRKSMRLKMPYEGVAGDATVHGEGTFFFPNVTDWCPMHLPLSKRLVPSEAKADKRELTHFAIPHEIPFAQAFEFWRSGAEGWDGEGLKKIVRDSMKQKEFAGSSGAIGGSFDGVNPQQLNEWRQAGIVGDRAWRYEIPVYYFYQMRPDKPGRPYDLTILSRVQLNERDNDPKMKLFERECYFPSIEQALHPLQMGCILDGERLWHRLLGLGHLNYSLAVEIERLLCRLTQAVHEDATNYWQVSDSGSRETLEGLLLKHNGILPEGVKAVENRLARNFTGLLQGLQLFRQQGAKNAMSSTANQGQQSDELEVQAIERQDQTNAAQSGHIANWADYMGALGAEICARFTNPHLKPKDKGYSEIMAFQAAMQRQRIPLRALRRENVNVVPARIAGDGVRQKALAEASFFLPNINLYPPQAQQKIKRRITAAVTDDYEFTDTLGLTDDKPDPDQVREALQENNVCIVQGIPPPVSDKDINPIHLNTHFQGLQSILQRAAQRQEEAFKPEEAEGFKALGAHSYVHIQSMEQMGDKEGAKLATDQLGKLAMMGQKFSNNMQQMQGEAQPQIDPVEAAKLQLAERSQSLKEDKNAWTKEKFDRTQTLHEHRTAHELSLKQVADRRQEKAQEFTQAIEDVRTAHDISKPEPAGV